MPGKVKPLSSSSQYVDLDPWNFALWWVIILVVHLVTFAYNTAYAMLYYELQKTYMYQIFEYFGIGMLAKDHHVIANVNAVMAALHGCCVLLMIGGSIWQRELAFSPWRDEDGGYVSMTSRRGSANRGVQVNTNDKTATRLMSAKLHTARVYSKLWGRKGLLGVNGGNFHAILIARELVETALQTVQAYRMSWYLPRVLLNRFYLCLLVLNCWSSVFVYSLLFKRNEPRRRFACLLCDCILDLVSCIGVPLIVVLSYAGQYNPRITGFDMETWYNEEWSAHVLNEFQMVLVTSWSDLMSRTVFSFGLISTTTSLKELLRRAPTGSKRRIACAADSVRIPDKPARSKNPPASAGPTLDGIVITPQKTIKVGGGSYGEAGVRSHGGRIVLHMMHFIFGLWGVLVLGLHIQASMQRGFPQCTLQVHPWALSEPACYLAVLDCHRLGITGRMDEIEEKWSEFDRSSVVTLAFRHCTELEIPDMIAEFHQTSGIKFYNSTISAWGSSAAITNTNHPALGWVFLVRVNMTDGLLPEGLQSADFPAMLYDIEICYSNLRELPEDLDTKWLVGTMVYIEYSDLTSVPPPLTRLDPYYLALTGNPITELPPELFEIPDMLYLGIGSTLINELPRNVTNLSPLLSFIYMTNTNISFFWPWIDLLVERKLEMPRPLLMGGSTYCAELENLTSGKTDRFSVLPSSEYSTFLTDPSEDNRAVILHTVNCEVMYGIPFYPIALEDSNSALNSVTLLLSSGRQSDVTFRTVQCKNQLVPVRDQPCESMTKVVKHLPSPSQYVDITPWSFAVWWFILLSVHLVTFGYNTAYAMFYYALQHTYLYQMLEYVGIGMPAEDHHVIANKNAVMAALHGMCVLLMVGGSLWRRELAFAPWSDEDDTDPVRMTSSVSSQKIPHLNDPDRTASRLESAKLRTVQVYTKLWGRQGTLGVNGGNFHMILITRELLETVLQTIQAYRMSWYLPRMLFNRFYLVLLVLNCWPTVFIYLLPFKGSEARKRFGCLLCDCFLDLLSCIGVPLIVVLSYVGQYDAKMTGFAMEKWYDDEWSAHAVNEFQMVLVTSWSDLASRTVFSFGLISTTLIMKELLRRTPTGSKRRVTRVADSVWKLGRLSQPNISPETTLPTLNGILNAQESLKAIKVDNGIHRFTGLRSRTARVSLFVAHAIFGMWGIMILGVHIQASMQPELAQCILQVHPWAVAKPACYLAVLDCYRQDIEGKMDEVESKWREFDRSTVVTLVMRHCPALEIPDLISDFHQTSGVKVYNSTIQTWEASAAVTNTNHPALIWLYLVRVNMTDGILPAGILSADFPALLYDIEICYSNLREVPDDLDSKWLVETSIYIEYNQLTSVTCIDATGSILSGVDW